MFSRFALTLFAVLAAISTQAPRAEAKVVRLEIISRRDLAGGATFGTVGAYELILARAYFELDPRNAANAHIVDLALAPRNARGMVECSSEVAILRPKDRSRGADLALIDVVNRGSPLSTLFLKGAGSGSPESAAFWGDALLMRRGVTIVAVGWQWDVEPGGGEFSLHFNAPPAGDNTKPVYGLVRSDWTVDSAVTALPLGHRSGSKVAVPYPVVDARDPEDVLTVRDTPLGARVVVARGVWHLGTDAAGHPAVVIDNGFTPGKIYEFVYRAHGDVVAGAGLAAIRDVASYLKYDPSSVAPVHYTLAMGSSQSGRLLREFLYDGFNADEQNRASVDGFFIFAAGAARGSFNQRFAQPSRDVEAYSDFFYPVLTFPFTSLSETDPVTHATGALRASVGAIHYEIALPKVFYVDDAYEYWGEGASLAHTSVDGTADATFLPSERRYVIAGAQHVSGDGLPSSASRIGASAAFAGDPVDQRPILRALLMDLVTWVKGDAPPPPSVYPTIASRTLVPPASLHFPAMPGVATAHSAVPVYRLDFGARWASSRIVDREPPAVGAPFTVLVPQVDSLGNDAGGIRPPEVQVPLATYFPWQVRAGTPDRLVSFNGTFVPLPWTEAQRSTSGDARPSVQKLYATHLQYTDLVAAACKQLVTSRFLLAEDVPGETSRLEAIWNWAASPPK